MSRASGRPAAGVAGLSAILLLATACSGGDDDGEQPVGSPATGATHAAGTPIARVSTRTTLRSVSGRLPRKRQQAVEDQVAEVVDAWFAAAYLGGDYPRTDFEDAFPGFSRGAAKAAGADAAVMTNRPIGARVETVEATRRRLRLDVLAVQGRAVGVTAVFGLDYDTTGEVRRAEEIRGELYLTRSDGDWRVFGYDAASGAGR